MAGEKIAKLYESLTAIAVRQAIKGTPLATLEVIREVKLPGISIRNDVIVGESAKKPSLIFLVTHSSVETMWERKFKRDSAELIELAISDLGIRGIFLVLFDNSTLPALLKIARYSMSGIISAAAFDPAGTIRDLSHNEKILAQLDRLDEKARQKELSKMFAANSARKLALKNFIQLIKRTVARSVGMKLTAGGYIPLTKANIARRQRRFRARDIRHTRFNRGVSKLAFFSPKQRDALIKRQNISGAFQWGTFDIYWPIDNKSKGQLLTPEGRDTYRCTDPEVLGGPLGLRKKPIVVESIADFLELPEINHIISHGWQPMADRYQARIQAKQVFDASLDFIHRHYTLLTKGRKLGAMLIDISADPSGSFEKHCGKISEAGDIHWNWLYTGLVALFKASKKSKQGYGYSKISAGMTTPQFRSQVEHSALQNLEYCLKTLSSALVIEAATSMAGFLEKLGRKALGELSVDPFRYLLLSEVEDKWMPHAIDVLPAMIERAAERHRIGLEKTCITSCLAVAAEAGGTAGRTNVYRVGNTVIWYKAAHVGHQTDKRKELQSTVASWRQTWNSSKQTFFPNTKLKQAVLVIDGDWEEEDLKLMHAFGWDEFLYPDELERLPDLIA